ncbi:MAG: ribosomal protein, partial [Marmoricola sp.]|nr:ribosomal protein [Marmoricola sp.]
PRGPSELLHPVPTWSGELTHHRTQGDTTNVAVKIRLKRMGKIRQPYYRVVVVDSRKKRDGKVIEEIGKYHPKEEPSFIEITGERVQYWLGVGAQPSEAVEALLKITGDWQTFKGLPGTEGTLKVAEPKRAKIDLFNEALKDAANEPKREAVTRKKAEKKAPAAETPEAPAAEETPVIEPVETPAEPAAVAEVVEAPAAEETPAVEPVETPAAEEPAAVADAPADETTEA